MPAKRPGRAPRRRPSAGDRLAEYAAKRDFAVTPEPAPGRAALSAGPPTFMVVRGARGISFLTGMRDSRR